MPQINLLPWRAEQRKERKLAFLVALGGGTLAALLATFVIYLMFNSLISGQQQRNDRLKAEIATLDKQIEEINNLEAQKQRFISRMEIIEKLQRSRPEIVHVFDELVRTLPDGTFLTGVTQTGNRLKLDGVAVRRTLSGRLALSFPERRDGNGRSHALVRPFDDATRRAIEVQVFSALARDGRLSA